MKQRKNRKNDNTLFQIMPAGSTKPRTYRKIARREFLRFTRNRRPKKNVIRKTLRKQLQYVERNLRSIKEISEVVGLTELSRKQYSDLDTIKEFARSIGYPTFSAISVFERFSRFRRRTQTSILSAISRMCPPDRTPCTRAGPTAVRSRDV